MVNECKGSHENQYTDPRGCPYNVTIIIYVCPVDIFSNYLYKCLHSAAVAQSVEQRTENPRVNSSILFGGTFPLFLERVFLCPLFKPVGTYTAGRSTGCLRALLEAGEEAYILQNIPGIQRAALSGKTDEFYLPRQLMPPHKEMPNAL